MIRRLAVVGVGLLGGSVARAARALGLAAEIVGVGRDATRMAPAIADGTLDRVATDLAEGVAGADFVVLAAPVATIEAMLGPVARATRDAVVTDVGSTKAAIVQTAERVAAERPFGFVGSHPMAGSERTGYALARPDLFRGSTVLVTPTDRTAPHLVKEVSAFWERVGAAHVITLDPEAHDRAVAAISHLPHLVACALVDAVERIDPAAFEVAARGFRDTTRIAAGDPEMWMQIFLANRAALGAGVREFSRALEALARVIEAGDADAVRTALAAIKRRRETLA